MNQPDDPLVLIAGVITLAPLIGDIPGVPTLLGLMVLLTLGRLVFQRHSIWVPSKLARRNIEREKFARASTAWPGRPALWIAGRNSDCTAWFVWHNLPW